jgi:DNA-binding NarL/FixJ family response regulator
MSESFPTGRESVRGPGQSGFRGKQSARLARMRRRSIRVLVMSDHELTREALCSLLRKQPALRLVGEAQNDPRGLTAAREKPDVILIDLDSRRDQGFDFLSNITKGAGQARLLVLTGAPISEVYQVIRLGVTGVVSKEKPASFLVKAIEHVNGGEVWLDRSITAQVVREVLFPDDAPENGEAARIATLTKREREVIALVGAGSKNDQIADRLSITLTTVKHHLTSIFDKLGVADRFGLVFYAYKHRLASPPH